MSKLNFVVGKSHFTMLGSQKAAPEAVKIGEVPDSQNLDVTFAMPAKGTEKEFLRAIRKSKGRELTRSDVTNIKLATSLVRAAMQTKTTETVTDAEARVVIEAAQWNCVKLRQALGLTPKQFKPISAAVQAARVALKAAKGYKFSNKEIIALQDGTPAHRAKLLRALKKDGATRIARNEIDRMHGEQRATVSYKVVRDKWGIKLAVFRDKNGKEFIDSDGSALTLPNYYFGAVQGLHGLRSRAHAHTNYVVHPEPTEGKIAAHATNSAFPARATMFEIGRMQGFPVDSWVKTTDKSAQVYLSLGGDNGTKCRADAGTMCKSVGIRVPTFFTIPSDGTDADGDYTDGATVENALDLQDICALGMEYAGVIPCANTANSFAGGFQTFVSTDTFNVDGVEIEIDTLSCSWGMAEDNTSQQDLARLQRIGVNAMLKHKVVTCATGDNGSKDSTDHATPDAPSSVVGFIGLAGVFIDTADGKTINVIKVWFDGSSGTGGGISKFFPRWTKRSPTSCLCRPRPASLATALRCSRTMRTRRAALTFSTTESGCVSAALPARLRLRRPS